MRSAFFVAAIAVQIHAKLSAPQTHSGLLLSSAAASSEEHLKDFKMSAGKRGAVLFVASWDVRATLTLPLKLLFSTR